MNGPTTEEIRKQQEDDYDLKNYILVRAGKGTINV
jgi:hypothetical protein